MAPLISPHGLPLTRRALITSGPILWLGRDADDAAARKQRRRPKYTYTTEMFTSTTGFTIPANQQYTNAPPIVVSDMPDGPISRIVVTWRSFTHTDPGLLNVSLFLPFGASGFLLADVANGHPANAINLTIDSRSRRAMPRNAPLASQRYRPTNYQIPGDVDYVGAPTGFRDLLGQWANHTWGMLFIQEQDGPGGGGFFNWSVTLTVKTRR